MNSLEQIVSALPEGKVEGIFVGAHWSAVVLTTEGQRRCGLASNIIKGMELNQAHLDTIASYEKRSGKELAQLVLEQDKVFPGIGMAAINALMPQNPNSWVDRNAGDLIAEKGAGKRVALVGHFPFVPEVRRQVSRLDILELRPQEGDFHASQAPEIIPEADVVAITSMAYVNGTMEGLLALCPPEVYVIILGPSTPLNPDLFTIGIDMLCGSIVERIDPVCTSVVNGDSFQMIRKNGVRLVAIENPSI